MRNIPSSGLLNDNELKGDRMEETAAMCKRRRGWTEWDVWGKKKQEKKNEKMNKKKSKLEGEKGLNTKTGEKSREGERQSAREWWKLSCALPWRRSWHTHKHIYIGLVCNQHTRPSAKHCQGFEESEWERGWRRMLERKRELITRGGGGNSHCLSLQIFHVSIWNLRCLFMGQYIGIAAPFRSHFKWTALAIDLSGLYSHSP